MTTSSSFRMSTVEPVSSSNQPEVSIAMSATRASLVTIIIVHPIILGSDIGVWIGNCVGYSNTHLFLLFLLVNTLLLAYSTYLHYLIFSYQVAEIRAIQRKTIASFGSALHSYRLRPTHQLYWSVILDAELGGALSLISAMISAVTFGFTTHHSWLLSTGTTTNETFKWADIKDALAVGEIVVLDQDDPFMYFHFSAILIQDKPYLENSPSGSSGRRRRRRNSSRRSLSGRTSKGRRQGSEIMESS